MDIHRVNKTSAPDDAPIPLEAEPAPARPAAKLQANVPGGSSPPRQASSAQRPAPRGGAKCPKCGYDLAGIRGEVCPECGGKVTIAVLNAAAKRASAKQSLGKDVRRATLTAVIALGAVAGVLAVMGEIGLYPMFLLSYAIFVPLGLAVYFGCCMAWIGFDQPWRITTLRLIAIYAVADAVALMIGMVLPVPIVGSVIAVIVSISLMMKWLDLELHDAVLVSVITFVVKLLAVGVVVGMLVG